jgi:hypothetical protein
MNQDEMLKQIYSQFESIQKKYETDGFDESELNFEELLGESMQSLQDEIYEDSTKVFLGVQKIHGDAVLPRLVCCRRKNIGTIW